MKSYCFYSILSLVSVYRLSGHLFESTNNGVRVLENVNFSETVPKITGFLKNQTAADILTDGSLTCLMCIPSKLIPTTHSDELDENEHVQIDDNCETIIHHTVQVSSKIFFIYEKDTMYMPNSLQELILSRSKKNVCFVIFSYHTLIRLLPSKNYSFLYLICFY
jgi:hypothetical protein